MAGYKKSGEEMAKESKRRKSAKEAKEAEANLEARIAGYQTEARNIEVRRKKPELASAAEALAAAKARSEAGKAVWEERQAKDAKIIEEQREKIAQVGKTKFPKGKRKVNENIISRDLYKAAKAADEIEVKSEDIMETEEHPPSSKLITSEKAKTISGEINLESKLKKSDRAKLDRILEAYEEADSADKFFEFMLENSDIQLTKERVEKDPALAQYLKSNFEEQELGLRYEDLVQALPTEQDYLNNVMGKVEEAAKPKKVKVIPAKSPARTVEPAMSAEKVIEPKPVLLPPEEVVEEKTEMQETFEKAQATYAQAYREFDPKFTKNKSNDLVAVTRPPFLAFGAKAKELKNLYQAMDTARKNAASEADEAKIKKNLPVASSRSLDLKRRAALEESWYESEEGKKEMGFEPVPRADYLKPQPEKAKMPKTRAELSEGIRSSEKVVDYLGGVIEQQAEGKKKKMDEIMESFIKKYKMSAEFARKFLLGPEASGLFKGKQRQMQREYKSLYNSPTYQEWLKEKRKRQ